MMKEKKIWLFFAFTLIELVLIVFILWFVLMMTARLWNFQLVQYRHKQYKQHFISSYETVLFQASTTNRIETTVYDEMHLSLSGDNFLINYYFDWKSLMQNIVGLSPLAITGQHQYGQNFFLGTIIQKPYQLWCVFSWERMINKYTWFVYFDLIDQKTMQKSCFQVDLLTCKLFEYRCQ